MKKYISVFAVLIVIFLLIVFNVSLNINKKNITIEDENNKNINIYNIKNLVNKENSNSKFNNPLVPEGFKKVETNSASWELDTEGNPKGWNNGLVIEDEKGNQFVWIPCTLTGYNNTVQYSKYYVDSIVKDTWKLHKENEILTSDYAAPYRR